MHADPAQRLQATSAAGGLLLGVLVLGLGFVRDDAAPIHPTLEVILTETRSEHPPEQADFLAQVDHQGGGQHEQAQRPSEPVSSPVPKPEPGLAPIPIRAQAPRPQLFQPQPVLASRATNEPMPQAPPRQQNPPRPLPSGEQPIEQAIEMARLTAAIERREARYARRPHRKFVSASTREYAYAQYLHHWVERVERVGNANYPERARIARLEGQLVMTVAVRRDGTLESVTLNQPSRHEILNQAARRIAELAAPYARLPATEDPADVLHITRTWVFRNGEVLSRE